MEADGTAITLVSMEEMADLRQIKALTKTKIQELKSGHASQGASPEKYDASAVKAAASVRPRSSRPRADRYTAASLYKKHRPARY
jgi:hypothetical protein